MNIGKHYIVELFDIPSDIFTNILNKQNFFTFDNNVQTILQECSMTVLNRNIHHFENLEGAFTALYLLSESHLSLHSWPEHKYIALDIFTCGNCNNIKIINNILKIITPGNYHIQEIIRGPL